MDKKIKTYRCYSYTINIFECNYETDNDTINCIGVLCHSIDEVEKIVLNEMPDVKIVSIKPSTFKECINYDNEGDFLTIFDLDTNYIN